MTSNSAGNQFPDGFIPMHQLSSGTTRRVDVFCVMRMFAEAKSSVSPTVREKMWGLCAK